MSGCGCSTGGPSDLLIGSEIVVPMTFYAVAEAGVALGDPIDPTSIDVIILQPDGTTVPFDEGDTEITGGSPDVGEFEFRWTPTMAGEHWMYVAGSGGGIQKSAQRSFTVQDTHVPLP